MEKQKNKNQGKNNKRMWVLRHPFGTIFLVFGIFIFSCFGFLYWVGYELFENKSCYYWRPGMTKDEKILAALEWANHEGALAFEMISPKTGIIYNDLRKQAPYENAKTILREQPGCCHVYTRDTAKTDHPNEDLRGNDEGIVVLHYVGRYQRINEIIGNAPTISYVDFNFCKK